MSILRTKSIEDSIAETRRAEYQLKKTPQRRRPHRLRHRRHHRRRHLHPDRPGGEGVRRPVDRALVRHRRGRAARSPRSATRSSPRRCRCRARPTRSPTRPSASSSPGSSAGTCCSSCMLGRQRRGAGLVAVLRDCSSGSSGITWPDVARLRRALRPAGVPAGRGAHGAGHHRHQGVDAGQPGARRASSCSSCCSSSWPASASSTPPTTPRSSRRREPGEAPRAA